MTACPYSDDCFSCPLDDCLLSDRSSVLVDEYVPFDIPSFPVRKPSLNSYYLAHREECIVRSKAWYQAHREECIARSKARYQANREECIARSRARYWSHRDEMKAYQMERQRRLKSKSD